MGDLEPITRNEKLWSGEDLTPVTRREMYIKHLYDETQVIPEYPVTREEMFILKAGEELHDVTIEQLIATENKTYSEEGVAYSPVIVNVPQTTLTTLDVTENGTYTAPSGTAYSEVDVDVPLPENAYLLKEIEDVEIASFNDGSDLPMPKLEVGIEPVQDLHGYDAPWVGGAGKNKVKPYSYTVTAPNGVTFTYNGDGSVTLNGTATASQAVPSVAIAVQNNLTFTLPSGTYIPSVSANNVTYEVYDVATSTLLSNGASFTLTEAKTILFRVGAVNRQTYNNLKVYMQIESGSTATTYAPYSNICPIIGWDEVNVGVSGVNIWDEEWEVGELFSDTVNSKNYIPVVPNKEYCFVYNGDISKVNTINGIFYDANYQKLDGYAPSGSLITYLSGTPKVGVFTAPSEAQYFKFRMQTQYGTTYNNDISINYPSTDTSYHAYNGQTYTIDLDGTRYGGKVDLVSGVMTVDRAHLTIDDFSSFGGSGTSAGGLHWFDVRNKPEGKSGNKNICSICGYIQNGWTSTITVMSVAISETIPVRIYDSSESLSDFKDKYPNLQVCYELATPFTVQLPPTVVKSLRGKNNVWADSGNILDLSYLAKEE